MPGKPQEPIGPDMSDVWRCARNLEKELSCRIVITMEAHAVRVETWFLRIIGTYEPRGPIAALRTAMERPDAVTWECLWSQGSLLNLTSTLYRGLIELDVEMSQYFEQLELPF